MKCNFCKLDPSHIWRWFEMRFQWTCYRCVSVQMLWLLKSDFKVSFESLAIRHTTTMSNPEWWKCIRAEFIPASSVAEFFWCDRGGLHRDLTAWQQPLQIGRWCLDTQIRSDHLQMTVRTVCIKDLIWETNLIRLQSEQSLIWSSQITETRVLYYSQACWTVVVFGDTYS